MGNRGNDLYYQQTHPEPPDSPALHDCHQACTYWHHPKEIELTTHDSPEAHEAELAQRRAEHQFDLVVPPAVKSVPDILSDLKRARGDAPHSRENVYTSGPMRGYPDLNHAAFDSLEAALDASDEGWVVRSPAASNRYHKHDNNTPYSEAIRVDILSILECEAIMLMPGWRQSEGARFEAEIARSLGLQFYEATYEMTGETFYDAEDSWTWQKMDPKDIAVEGIDQEARRLVYGERAATYGHPRGDFDTIAKIWSGILGVDVKATQVSLMMAGLKLARLASSPEHHDSQVDTIGYMLCHARLFEDEHEIAAWDQMASRNRASNEKDAQ